MGGQLLKSNANARMIYSPCDLYCFMATVLPGCYFFDGKTSPFYFRLSSSV
ncbi:hypothetical protein EPIR_1191 [Erwinia piriflorinigrans CFBP 5888]|uniref:Uncharacterized protein n=1 Tax=Erwinia piriflorinigrans CFBP 5888 TaxID=1161919 RepID=V5Z5F3_9GAMM|nr:hypothetical protein EPIR_1191 [Erwinia piriflorinigrans CFBP 5888]